MTDHQQAIATPTQIQAKRARDAALKQAFSIAALIGVGLRVLFFLVHAAMTARLHDAMANLPALAALPIYAAVTSAGIKLPLETASLPLCRFAWSHTKLREIGMAGLARRGFESWTRKTRLMVPHPYWYYDHVRDALNRLSDQQIVKAPTLPALANLIEPALAEKLVTGKQYEAAYAAWLETQKNVAGQAAMTTWTKFLAHVKPTDRFSDELLAATFSAILFHIRHPDKDQNLSQYAFPAWVVSDFGAASSTSSSGSSDSFGSGFGGRSSGGGGFGGSW